MAFMFLRTPIGAPEQRNCAPRTCRTSLYYEKWWSHGLCNRNSKGGSHISIREHTPMFSRSDILLTAINKQLDQSTRWAPIGTGAYKAGERTRSPQGAGPWLQTAQAVYVAKPVATPGFAG
jgi:hypothetical protein